MARIESADECHFLDHRFDWVPVDVDQVLANGQALSSQEQAIRLMTRLWLTTFPEDDPKLRKPEDEKDDWFDEPRARARLYRCPQRSNGIPDDQKMLGATTERLKSLERLR